MHLLFLSGVYLIHILVERSIKPIHTAAIMLTIGTMSTFFFNLTYILKKYQNSKNI